MLVAKLHDESLWPFLKEVWQAFREGRLDSEAVRAIEAARVRYNDAENAVIRAFESEKQRIYGEPGLLVPGRPHLFARQCGCAESTPST